jgi:ABC-type transporter MlaC component
MHPRRSSTLCAAAVLAASAFAQPAQPQSDAAAQAFLTSFYESVRAIHASLAGGDSQVRERCRELMRNAFDLDAMALYAIAGEWTRLTAAARSSYRAAFEERTVTDCVRRIRNFRGETMTFLGTRPFEGGDLLAAARFALEGETGQVVAWRLRANGSQTLRAVDVIVDGRSMMIAERNEYASVLRNHDGDINTLITFMLR